MKATIVRPDGTRIEVEGTPEEIAKLVPPTYVPSVQGCTCYTAWPCPLHTFRWPGVFYGPVANVCAAAIPNMGQAWVGTIHAGAAAPLRTSRLPPPAAAAACVPTSGWFVASA